MLLALSLNGAGSHPAAQPPDGALTLAASRHWIRTMATVESAPIDLVTIADRPGAEAAQARLPSLDATMLACRLAPVTTRVGLVPEIATAPTEPFLVSSQLATLDFVSGGRAGWSVVASAATGVTRSGLDPAAASHDAEALEHVEIVRRLWDSWDDDAEIRDHATNRFVDRDRLHHIDFEGTVLAVKGPSITPRPPQGQPVIAVEVEDERSVALAAAHADLVFLAAAEHAISPARVADAIEASGRDPALVRMLVDVRVVLDNDPGRARERVARLDGLVPGGWSGTAFAGTPTELATLLAGPAPSGVDGYRLHPAELEADLPAILPATAPLAAADPTAGVLSLRARLGLPRPENRYARARA